MTAVISTELVIPESIVEEVLAEVVDEGAEAVAAALAEGTITVAEVVDAEVDASALDEKPAKSSRKPKAVVEVTPTAIVDSVILTEEDANALDQKLRAAGKSLARGYDTLINLMERAADGSIHIALGYATLVDYFNNAVSIKPTDKDERQLMVEAMSTKGFSQRLIGKTLGVSQSTVRDALAQPSSDYSPPATTQGIDGKEYTRAEKPADGDAEAVTKPRQAAALKTAIKAATKVAELLEDVFADTDNFDADVNPELIAESFKEFRAQVARINKVSKSLSSPK